MDKVHALKEIFDVAKSLSSTLDVDTLLKRIDSAAEEDFEGLADFFAPRIAAGESRGALDAVERSAHFDQPRPNA